MPQITYWHIPDELIIIPFSNLCRPQSYFPSILNLISWHKFLPLKSFSKVLDVFWDILVECFASVTLCHYICITIQTITHHYNVSYFLSQFVYLAKELLELTAYRIQGGPDLIYQHALMCSSDSSLRDIKHWEDKCEWGGWHDLQLCGRCR